MAESLESIAKRFWSKVHKTRACWLWTGQIFPSGHGGFYWAPRRRMLASRASWILHCGHILPGFVVAHQCPNPHCVRPSHLALGSPSDNSRDHKRPQGQGHIPDYKKPVVDDITRFWQWVEKDATPEGCWLWRGAVSGNGYGTTFFDHRQHSAHRIAYQLLFGPIPQGALILHTCDVKLCVYHLYAGTAGDNYRDMRQRGLARVGIPGEDPVPQHSRAYGVRNGKHTQPHRTPRGQQHGNAKLTDADIVRIWDMGQRQHIPHRAIAATFGVSHYIIGRILRRQGWTHVDLPQYS